MAQRSSGRRGSRAAHFRQRRDSRYFPLRGEALEPRALLAADFGFVNTLGSASGFFNDVADAVVDSAGNVYVTGKLNGPVDLDPGAGVVSPSPIGAWDGFVAKYTAGGALVWAQRFGSSGIDGGQKLALDPSGNLWVTGDYSLTTDFDPGPGVASLTATGNLGQFLWKLSPGGSHLWVGSIDQSVVDDFGEETIYDLSIDAGGNVLAVGWFSGTVDLNPGPGISSATSATSGTTSTYDAFVLNVDNGGNFQWAKTFGGSVTNGLGDSAVAVATDAAGNAYVSGSFAGTVDLDPGPAVASFSSHGPIFYDNFLSKFDAAGNLVWVKTRAQGGADAIAVDAAGGLFTVGQFEGTADFDPGPGVANRTAGLGQPDIYVLKLDTNGAFQWVSQFGGSGPYPEYAVDFALDDSGEIYVTGQFSTGADFDPGPGVTPLNPPGAATSADFLLRLSGGGGLIEAHALGGPGNIETHALALNRATNQVYLGGDFDGTIDFDPGSAEANRTSLGKFDAFLLNLNLSGPAPPPPPGGGTISGVVWNDTNGNGARDTGELPLAGQRVFLDLDDDGVRDASTALEPDGFAAGTVLTGVDPRVALSVLGTSNEPLGFGVTAVVDAGATTGSKVFAHSGVPFFGNSRKLKMNFSPPVDRVAIDFSGGASIGTEIGRLEIYDAAGTLLNTYVTQSRAYRAKETMTLSTPGKFIAYAIAYTDPSGSFGRLDNLTFGPPEPEALTAADGSYQFTSLVPGTYVVRQELAPGGEQSAPLGTRGRLFVVDSFIDAIVELDPATGAVRRSLAEPPPGSIFNGLGFDGKTLFYLNGSTNILYEVHPDTGAIFDTTQLPSAKSYSDITTLDGLVYLQEGSKNVDVFDPISDTILRSFTVNASPLFFNDGLAELAGPNRLMAQGPFRQVWEIDPATGIGTVAFELNSQFSYASLGSIGQEIFLVATAKDEIHFYSRTGTLLRKVPIGPSVYSMAGGTVFDGAHRVTVSDSQTVSGRDFGVTTPGAFPVATNDAFVTSEDTPLVVGPDGLLRNDTDPNGEALTASLQTPPAAGAVQIFADGAFIYTPAANFNGTDSFTYRVSDGVLSSVATVSFNVLPVNDAPSFTKGPDLQVLDESPGLAITNWATAISAGPAGESTPPAAQSVSFQVTVPVGGDELFAQQPAIDAQGTLRLTPRPGASGTTQVTVTLRDSGGTLGNGVDASAAQTFSITVSRQRPWYNITDPLDTSADGDISPIDAVLVINYLNGIGGGPVPPTPPPPHSLIDVDGDGSIAPIDAVLVINWLNAPPAVRSPAALATFIWNPLPPVIELIDLNSAGGQPAAEGESSAPETSASVASGLDDVLALLALDTAAQPKRRRF